MSIGRSGITKVCSFLYFSSLSPIPFYSGGGRALLGWEEEEEEEANVGIQKCWFSSLSN